MSERIQPSTKAPAIEALLKSLAPSRGWHGRCATCDRTFDADVEFKGNDLGLREYKISWMCAKCQEGVFGPS